jgi:hypothetical protein
MASNASGRARRLNFAPTWQSWIILLIAVWFFISPWILQFATTANAAADMTRASWNAWVLSVVIAVVTLSAIGPGVFWQAWADLALAVWVFIAPWVLGFANGPAAAWDHWICGVLFAIFALGNITMAPAARAPLAEPGYAGTKPGAPPAPKP